MTHPIDFAALERPSSPNTHLLAPDGLCAQATPDGAAPVFDTAPSSLFRAVKGVVQARAGWRVTQADDAALRLAFVATSPLMRFKDDVTVQVLPEAENAARATLAVYSASRVGYSDLGANGKRVAELIRRLQDEQGAG